MSERYAFWVTLRPHLDCWRRGKAEVRILYFKTTWSEFQKANQTATEQDNAERISNQNICSPYKGRSQAVVCVSTPRKYPRSGYFLVKTYLGILPLAFRHNTIYFFFLLNLGSRHIKNCSKTNLDVLSPRNLQHPAY